MTVEAGLLANAVGQVQLQRMTESVRQQAGSYRFSGEWISVKSMDHSRGRAGRMTLKAGPDV